MSYQVLIPCAGIGSRLRNETKLLNKSLIHIKNKPIISYILEKFPNDCEFIIPVGYRGKDLIDYLNIAHKDRKFIYENISPYEGEGSSLGHTLSKVVDNINDSFVFISCDTLVAEEIPSPRPSSHRPHSLMQDLPPGGLGRELHHTSSGCCLSAQRRRCN